MVRQFKAVAVERDLLVEFTTVTGKPLICGLEIIAEE